MRTQINGFTGEVEVAADLQIAPSPADQRALASNVKDMSLLDASEQFIQGQINKYGDNEPSPDPNYPIPVDQGGTGDPVPPPPDTGVGDAASQAQKGDVDDLPISATSDEGASSDAGETES